MSGKSAKTSSISCRAAAKALVSRISRKRRFILASGTTGSNRLRVISQSSPSPPTGHHRISRRMPGMGGAWRAGHRLGVGLSGPEDVEDDQDFGALVNAERQEPVLAKLGLAELRLVPARVHRRGVLWRIGQRNDPFHDHGIEGLVAYEVTELRGGPPEQAR